MKFLFILIVMGCPLFSTCQEIRRNPNGDGTFTENHYVDNVIKKQKTFYASGNIRSETNYESEDPNHGTYREWYDNGQIREERNLDGNQEGIAKGWFNDGRLRFKTAYTEGIETTKAYFPSGQLSRTYSKKYNKLNGKDTRWHENGQLKQESNYLDGKSHGTQKFWNEEGVLISEGASDMGKRIYAKLYYDSGTLKMEVNYTQNASTPYIKCFDEYGNLKDCQ